MSGRTGDRARRAGPGHGNGLDGARCDAAAAFAVRTEPLFLPAVPAATLADRSCALQRRPACATTGLPGTFSFPSTAAMTAVHAGPHAGGPPGRGAGEVRPARRTPSSGGPARLRCGPPPQRPDQPLPGPSGLPRRSTRENRTDLPPLHVARWRRRHRREVRAGRPRRGGRAGQLLSDGPPLADPQLRSARRPHAGGLRSAHLRSGPHQPRHARRSGHLRDVPRAGAAAETGRHARRALRRPSRPGARRRLVRGGAPRTRLPFSASGGAFSAAGGDADHRPADVGRRRRSVRGPALHLGRTLNSPPASRCPVRVF
jgi:hypothetical protein